jgi:CRP-like cAMP-binding protein
LGYQKDLTRICRQLLLFEVESAMPATAVALYESPVREIPDGNRLLASLPDEDRLRLSPHLKSVFLRRKQAVLRQGQPVREIIFPTGGVCSLVRTTEDGKAIEILGVGAEGALGVNVAMGQAESATDVVVQIPSDTALSLPIEVFRTEMQLGGVIYGSLTRYCRILTEQLMHACACNALHSAEQRCCRWLLTTADRVGSDSFPVTQEILGLALGVRRPTVTFIMSGLHRTGVVEYFRGVVKVHDRAAMIARSCECYHALSPRRQ